MLYLVATPIGNLEDFSQRACRILQECDYILCEDTRHSSILLKHYQIHKPLLSYHKFNEALRRKKIVADLKEGKKIALLSDAGTPCLSDPGSSLVKLCLQEGFAPTGIPGPCAAILALISTGFDTSRFQFVGFLPKKAKALQELLQEILAYSGTSICYESPHRIQKVLECLKNLEPTRRCAVARELTKKFEEVAIGTAEELLSRQLSRPFKGEITLLVAASDK
jgi:16S rRNA (cytidine1402-2'-O)-methyltransferase